LRLRLLPFNSTARRVLLIWMLILCACASGAALRSRAGAQELKRRGAENTHGILSQVPLTPSLHSRPRALRFSPNGRYILLQDESIIYVIARSPLAIKLAFPARMALPVRFSADSSMIVIALQNMHVQRRSIEGGQIVDTRTLGTGTDCYVATLSPQGDLYACLNMRSELHVFRVDSGEEVFSGRTGDSMSGDFEAILPFHVGLAHSEPFGYYIGGVLPPTVDRMATATNLEFSPNGRYLIALNTWRHVTTVDLEQRKKFNLPTSLRRAAEHGSLEFVADDRVAYVAPEKAEDSALLAFPGGQELGKLNIAGTAWGTSDPRYLLHLAQGDKEAEVIDLQTAKPVAKISKDGGDIFADEAVSYSADEGLALARLGRERPNILARVPPGPLPILWTAIASSDLETLAVGVAGQGALFRVSSGAQIASFPNLRGAWFDGEQECYVRVPQTEPSTSALKGVNVATGASETLWPLEETPLKNDSLISGPVMLSEVITALYVAFDSQLVGYDLHALDLKTGKLLWSRDFGGHGIDRSHRENEPAVTFTDPQGERVVLGWGAKTDAARIAAKHSAAAVQAMKHAKITERDTVFEVLDARTGNILGAAFVPGGSGPKGYTGAFSAGDWLILVKDGIRFTAVSLNGGDERLRLTALDAAISADGGLLSATEEGGRLLLYDLKTATRRNVYTLPNDVVYERFSSDGKRILALTQDQMVYILDATALSQESP
jgi:hypothetical protein